VTVGDQKGPKPRTYTDLTLQLGRFDPSTERYEVTLSGSSVGELEPAAAHLAHSEIEEALLELEDGGIEEEEDLVAFGRALADRLLPAGELRTRVTEALRGLGLDSGVRLRLLIWEPRLAQLPWEYTYLSLLGRDSPSDFLVLNPLVSLVRHEPLPLQHTSVVPRDPDRLRMVAVTANVPGYLELDLRRERQIIDTALGAMPPDGAAIEYAPILVDPSEPALRAALLRGADLFHFAGHGGLRDGRGFVALPPEEGTEVTQLTADALAILLRGAGVRVALLGACESGRRDTLSRWDGVAPALVAGAPGVPAVVAMQYRVLDSSALKVARAFDTPLAVGLSVDEAVSQGRLALFDPDDISAPWGIPVLYLRSTDGVVFPHLATRPSATAAALRSAVNQVVRIVDGGGEVTAVVASDPESLRSVAALGAGAVSQSVGEVRGSGKVTGIRVGTEHGDRNRAPATAPSAAHADAALQAVRLRYARGEISREEFAQLIQDLGGAVPDAADSPSPDAG
jgi:hypothetical protein